MADAEQAEWQRARQETVATLRSVLCCNLLPARWELVQEVLAEMRAAVAVPDLAALQYLNETLELYMPVRVARRLGDESPEPAPGIVREQIADLVDALLPHIADGRGGVDFPGGPDQTAVRGA